VTGDAAGAIALARGARDAAVADDPKTAGFFHYALGEFARLGGDPATARAAYTAALALRADDLGALVGLARIDAFDGRDAAAIEGLEHAARIAPAPDTLALLADLQARAGRHAAADGTIATIRAIRQLSAVAGTVYDRQLTLFELDHDGAADAILADARAALADRADAAGHDVVAWALHRLGRDDEAATESAAALATGTRDARILFHAGAIELARGRHDDGRAHLRAALDLGAALDPAERAEAEALLSAP
jgi:tetratricopeptide (TPR) repeat protein